MFLGGVMGCLMGMAGLVFLNVADKVHNTNSEAEQTHLDRKNYRLQRNGQMTIQILISMLARHSGLQFPLRRDLCVDAYGGSPNTPPISQASFWRF